MDAMVKRIQKRLADPEKRTDGPHEKPLYPPTTAEKIAVAEKELGFEIPPLLVQLFTEVANGNFGPGYGISGVDGCGADENANDLTTLYHEQESEEWRTDFPEWPPRILRIAYLGCGMYAAVDCAAEGYPMYLFEPSFDLDPDEGGYLNCLVPYALSLNDWLDAWANGEDVQIPAALAAEEVE